MLSATLRDFVRDGLVQRRPDTRYVPQRVDYSLTELGMTFCKTIRTGGAIRLCRRQVSAVESPLVFVLAAGLRLAGLAGFAGGAVGDGTGAAGSASAALPG